MDKNILSKLLKDGVANRIYQKNLNKAFIGSIQMLMKDISTLESGNSNAKKNWSNPFTSNPNADRTSQNGDYDSSDWDKSAAGNSKTGFKPSSVKQIKYLRYLIYLLSKHYPNSSYNQIANEICQKNNLSAIDTNSISKAKAYYLIKGLKSMLPTTKPKAKPASKTSAGLPF